MIHLFGLTAVRKVSAPGSDRSNGALLFFLALVKRVTFVSTGPVSHCCLLH